MEKLLKILREFFDKEQLKDSSYIYNLLVLITTTLVLTYFISEQYITRPINLKPGDIATEEIKIERQIEIIDEAKIEKYKKIVEKTIPKVFIFNQDKVADALLKLDLLKNSVESIEKNYQGERIPKKVKILKEENPWLKDIPYYSLEWLFKLKESKIILDKAKRILLKILENGIVDNDVKRWKELENSGVIIKKGAPIEKELRLSIKNINSVQEAKLKLRKELIKVFPKRISIWLYAITSRLIVSTLSYSKEETEKLIQKKIEEKAKPIIYKAGQVIARPGDPITNEIYKVIQIINRERGSINFLSIIGSFLLILIMEGILILYITRNVNFSFDKLSNSIIISSLVVLIGFIAYLIIKIKGLKDEQIIYGILFPTSIPSIVLFILFNKRIGAIVGLFISIYIILITKGDIPSFFIAFSSIFLSLIGKQEIYKRSDIWRSTLNLFIGYTLLSFSFSVMYSFNIKSFFYNTLFGGVNSIITGIVVIGIFPIYENIFGITTNFKLLEFTDLNSPLLRELLIRAPGTYQHSIMVANLAERAASEIGANALLTKVGAYYHDIGKMKHPEYFVENQEGSKSIHDQVSPRISALMIISHVKEGLELAKEYNIPEPIRNFIPEHHGTTIVKYFYHKALTEKGEEEIKEEDFRYPGPKPRTKETAIVMLADSIEAASRTMDKPTPAKIEALVNKIISNKINEGQLDECNLTMKDLKIIKESFVKSLVGMFHHRIEYPEKKPTHKKEGRKRKNDKSNNRHSRK